MALADIPGYGAYIARRQMNEQAPLAELQQASGAMGLMAALEKRKREQQARQELQALGEAPTQEALATWAARYAGPEAVLKSQQGSLDRKTTIEAANINRAAQREQQIHNIERQGQQAIERVREAAAQQRITKAEADQREAAMRENMTRLVASLRPAPIATTEIVDPADPTRMLKINSHLYKGGTVGAPGVIGIAGKEPAAAKREEKEGQGKELLKTELDNLREHYRVLNESRAIPSSERGAGSNAAAWVQGSAVGQLGGRIIGTKEQDARNQIQSGRLRIMNAIKNATGMSAQQLNSNIELKTWLDSLTSLTGSYESNIGIIDAIEQAFLKGKGKSPSVDDLLEKYK